MNGQLKLSRRRANCPATFVLLVFDILAFPVEFLDYLRRQFAYDRWANTEVLTAIKAIPLAEGRQRPTKTLAHILSAERLWLERLTQRPQSLPVWPEVSLAQCEQQLAELAELWPKYLAQLSSPSLSEKINYTNSKGEPWSNNVHDVLTHILLHSAYHRGQIASTMRASGNTPAFTDFIHAVRQGLIE